MGETSEAEELEENKGVANVIFEERLNGEFSELQLQFSLILRMARQISQILQISAVICLILQISPGPANSKQKFQSKKFAKVCSQKILQSNKGGRRINFEKLIFTSTGMT